jgi:hypothetical protein
MQLDWREHKLTARATIAETPKDKIRADQMTSCQQAFDHVAIEIISL